MFKIIPNGINRLDIEMSGELKAEDVKIALDELVTKSQDIENGKMLYDVVDFHLPSLGAIAVEFSRLPKKAVSDPFWGLPGAGVMPAAFVAAAASAYPGGRR